VTDTAITNRRSTAPHEAHRQTVEADIHSVAATLRGLLGNKLTAYLAGSDDDKQPARWANGTKPNEDAEKRLRAAYQVINMIQHDDSSYVARAWMIGMNPQLEHEAPADVLREGRLRDVILAAQAFVSGG